MNWLVNDIYNHQIIESDNVLAFKTFLTDNNIRTKVVLSECCNNFWQTQEEIDARKKEREKYANIGCFGATGACGPPTQMPREEWTKLRPILEERKVLVNIEMVMSVSHSEQIQKSKLNLTPNPLGKTYESWRVSPIAHYLPYICGIYKKPGFDQAFNALHLLKPELTPESFARDENYDGYGSWDTDLVDLSLYYGDENCLDTVFTRTSVPSNTNKVNLSILAIDIPSNLEYLKKLLIAYKDNNHY
jgi:hypothetical protein